jgi:hypothetical protein
VHAAVFGADGHLRPGTDIINVAGGDTYPQVAGLKAGGFAITWLQGNDVFTATYDDNGQLQPNSLHNVSHTDAITEQRPQIVALTNGGYALSWATSDKDIYTAAFTAEGQPVDDNAFRVTESSGVQDIDPRMTALADGAYALAWYGLVDPPNPSDLTASLNTAVFQVLSEAPVITSNGGGDTAAVSVAENSTAVTTVVASDPDAGTTLNYAIAGGADTAKFTINSTTGALAFVTAPNFETPADSGGNNVYDVTVQVSDRHGGIDTQAIAVTVTDVDDIAPTVVSVTRTDSTPTNAQVVHYTVTFSEAANSVDAKPVLSDDGRRIGRRKRRKCSPGFG